METSYSIRRAGFKALEYEENSIAASFREMSESVQKLCEVLAADVERESTMQQEVMTANQHIEQLAADRRETNQKFDELKMLLVASL